MKREKPRHRMAGAHVRRTKGTAGPGILFSVLLFLSILLWQSASYGQAPPKDSALGPAEQVSVGLLGFRDDSGAGASSGIRKVVEMAVWQALVDQGLGPKWIDSDAGAGVTELTVDQRAAIGRRRGMRFVVQGTVSAIGLEDGSGEIRISVQLEAEVVSAEDGVARTVTAESSAISRRTDSEQVPTLSSVDLGNRDFAGSAFGRSLHRALSNAGTRLGELIYSSITAPDDNVAADNAMQDQRPQDDTMAQDQQPVEGGDIFEPPEGGDQTEEEQTAESEEDLQQLIAQAEEVVSGNSNVDAAQVEHLRQLLEQLLQKLEDKSRSMEAGNLAGTDQIDQAIETEKADLQEAVEQTYSDEEFRDESVQQSRSASSSLLERVNEYVGLTFNVIQRIQELRSAFNQAQNDYAAIETQPTWNQEQAQDQPQDQSWYASEPEEESLGEVSGVVTEEGEPVEGAVITEPLSEQTATTDETGSYTLKGIPTQFARLLVSRAGKSVAEGRINMLAGRTSIADFALGSNRVSGAAKTLTGARILPSAVTLTRKIGGTPGGTVSGVVQDPQGRPVPRTLVQLKGLSLARTDSRGRYKFTNVPVGPQLLTALKSGVKFRSQPVQVQARKMVAANIKVADAGSVVRPPKTLIIDRKADPLRTGALYGVVTDSRNRPVVGAKVSLNAVSKSKAVSVRTRADGRYEFRGLNPDSYRVVVARVGYNDFIRPVTLDAGKKASGNFRLTEATTGNRTKLIERAMQSMGEVRGFVRDASRKGIGRATVELKRTGGSTVSRISTDTRGKYVLKAVPGNYQLNVRKQGLREASSAVVLRPREPVTRDFQLEPGPGRYGKLAGQQAKFDGLTGQGTDEIRRGSMAQRQTFNKEPRPADPSGTREDEGRGSRDDRPGKIRGSMPNMGGLDQTSKGGMFIEEVVPGIATPGSIIRIHGHDFGATQDKKLVAINGNNRVHPMKPVSWSDSLIRAEVPRGLERGAYLVLVYYDKSYRTSSNSKMVKLAAATQDDEDSRPADRISRGGMLIEEIVPTVAPAGSTIEIRGLDFGQIPGNKIVAINGHNTTHGMTIQSWSNRLIRARIPRNLERGGYLVLIYYDRSYRTSSNSKTIKVATAH